MKTIKVIDLLNKIANREEVPEYIGYRDISTHTYETMLVCKENIIYKLDQCVIDLNSKVEIIEEEKEIEKVLFIELLSQCDNWLQKRDVNIKSDFELNPYIINTITKNFELLYKKQCEIVDVVNELKKGSDNNE